MSNTHLTRCPHCQATFKVQDQHLGAAGGKVRCGSCLEVFNALESLIDSAPQTNAGNQAPASFSQPKKAPQPQPDPQQTTTEPVSSADEEDDTEFVFADNPDEDSEDDGYTGPGTFSSELSDSFLELEEGGSDHFSVNEPGGGFTEEVSGKKEESDESWAEQMLEDIDNSKPAARANIKPAASTMSVQNSNSLQLSDEFTTPDRDTSDETVRDNSHSNATPAPQPGINQAREEKTSLYTNTDLSHQYRNLQADPLDLPRSSDRSILGTLIWTILNLGLLVTLMAQLAWFHYDKLAQFSQLRPLYEKGCELAGCKLPDLVDTTKIKSQNLIVRSHPTMRKALIIDAVIVNQAPFEQPFPNLALYFSDLNNNIIAQRLFEPSDYLAGEVKGWKGMPKGTPIHISIEILDPGKDAVNYSVGFFKHTPRS